MILLKKDTAATIVIGPFVDNADGVTPETGLTTGGVDEIGIYKPGATSLTSLSGTTTLTHRAGGLYTMTLSSTDTETLGQGFVFIRDDSVCLPVWERVLIVPANVFDSLLGTDKLEIDVAQWLGQAVTADANNVPDVNLKAIAASQTAASNLRRGAEALVRGAVSGAGSTTTLIDTDLTETTDDHYNGRTIIFTSGGLAGQAAGITDYAGSTKRLTVSALTEIPSAADQFVIS